MYKEVVAPGKKLTTTISGDLGGRKIPAFYLFPLAGTACETLGQDHAVINTLCTTLKHKCRQRLRFPAGV